VDGMFREEIKATEALDADGYQYSVDDLSPGQTYDVAVKVCALQYHNYSWCNSLTAICDEYDAACFWSLC